VQKKLKTPFTSRNGHVREHVSNYWKCILKDSNWNNTMFEAAKKLKVGDQVFVRGEFYFTRYNGTDGKQKYVNGIILRELNTPKTLEEDARIAEMVSHNYPTWREKKSGYYKTKHGEKVITDGAIGKRQKR
jgi:single-stranded DNA-binding protein